MNIKKFGLLMGTAFGAVLAFHNASFIGHADTISLAQLSDMPTDNQHKQTQSNQNVIPNNFKKLLTNMPVTRHVHVKVKSTSPSAVKSAVKAVKSVGTSSNHSNHVSSSVSHVSASAVSNTGNSAEAAAKNWIAQNESHGSYTAQNGRYYGKYQLDSAYLHGNYSPANQESVANQYVKSRYGSWVNAKQHWLSNGWY